MESGRTVTHPDRSRLSERQFLAIEVLLAGGTHGECAAAAGVSRTTVTGWANHHVPFIAELDRRRQERSNRLSDVMGEALYKAVEVVVSKLDEGDLTAAVALLRLVGSSVLHQVPSARPVTIQSTATCMAEQIGSQMMLESFTPSHAVFAIETSSAAHADNQE
jgi:hypothetical protein